MTDPQKTFIITTSKRYFLESWLTIRRPLGSGRDAEIAAMLQGDKMGLVLGRNIRKQLIVIGVAVFASMLCSWGAAAPDPQPGPEGIGQPSEAEKLTGELSREAEIHLKSGAYDKAVKVLRQVVRLKPEDAAAHHRLALAYIKVGRYEDAVKASRQAILFQADFPAAHTCLGAAYILLDNPKEAVEALKRAIRLKADNPEAYAYLGAAYLLLNNYEDAAAAY